MNDSLNSVNVFPINRDSIKRNTQIPYQHGNQACPPEAKLKMKCSGFNKIKYNVNATVNVKCECSLKVVQ